MSEEGWDLTQQRRGCLQMKAEDAARWTPSAGETEVEEEEDALSRREGDGGGGGRPQQLSSENFDLLFEGSRSALGGLTLGALLTLAAFEPILQTAAS